MSDIIYDTTCQVLVTRQAPDFTAQAVMADNSFKEVKLSDYKGKYVILFFYPLDFTFVCPSEILAFNDKLDAFKKLETEVLAISIDSHFTHLAWKNTPPNKGGLGSVNFPIVSDLSQEISEDYGVRLDAGMALRGLFLIDKNGVVRHQVVNDLPLGRSVDEALRMVEALQYHEKHGEVCPADWKPGKKAMTASAEGVAEYLGEKHG